VQRGFATLQLERPDLLRKTTGAMTPVMLRHQARC
jgi:hypothetical protein